MDGSIESPRTAKTRISFITSLPPHRGISFYAVPLLEALGRRPDLEVEAVSFRRLYPSKLYPGGSSRDLTAPAPDLGNVLVREVVDGFNPASWLQGALAIRGDIVHAQWWSQILAPVYLTLLGAAKLRGKRIVLTVHNVSAHEPARWKRLADRSVMALADHFIVHAPENAQALARLVPHARGRISVIPMGPQAGHITGVTKSEARSRLGIARQEKVILFFGNIRPYKRLDIMLEAFESLRYRIPKARLLVVGQPWAGSEEVDRAVSRARRQTGVTLRTEYIPEAEVETYFAAADLVACPYSGFESQSAAASKALAHGKALVVSRTGGLVNLVQDQRAIIPPGDPTSLATAAEVILSDARLRRKLELDSARIAKSFSWDHIADETARLYLRLMSSASGDSPRLAQPYSDARQQTRP